MLACKKKIGFLEELATTIDVIELMLKLRQVTLIPNVTQTLD